MPSIENPEKFSILNAGRRPMKVIDLPSNLERRISDVFPNGKSLINVIAKNTDTAVEV